MALKMLGWPLAKQMKIQMSHLSKILLAALASSLQCSIARLLA